MLVPGIFESSLRLFEYSIMANARDGRASCPVVELWISYLPVNEEHLRLLLHRSVLLGTQQASRVPRSGTWGHV